MADYKLTNRGKFVLSLFILALVVLIIYSGSYIIKYFSNEMPSVSANTENTNESEEVTTSITETEIASEIETEITSEPETEITSEIDETTQDEQTDTTEEAIYSMTDLEDLKQFKIIFYFTKDSSKIELSEQDLGAITAMMEMYPSEKIAVEGHVNGYPHYEKTVSADALSLDRAKVIATELEKIGIDKDLISVYNLGSESPLFTDFGNQSKNDRVEVYFIDHFIKGSQGK